MKINSLEVDGFGVWSGLKLEGFDDGLNVFYGPNEAGKTTLLQFVRSILYGFSPERQSYLPPLHGGRPGGSIQVAGPNGQFQVSRYHDETGDSPTRGQLALLAADGTRQGEHLLGVLLAGIDEAIFNNVFAVGLQELQELATLSDTEAADLLYNLTAGLDRVSLVEVLRELEGSRSRILSPGGETCQLAQLLAEREKLRSAIDELGHLTRRYGHLAAQRNQLQREITRLEEENTQTEYQARVVELALSLRERWCQRTELDHQLAALGPLGAVSEQAVSRLDAINARLRKHQQRLDELKHRGQQLRAEAAGLSVNNALWREAPRIEALNEQQPWIRSLETEIAQIEKEAAALQAELLAEQQRTGLDAQTNLEVLPQVSSRALAALRPPARALRQCSRRLREAEQKAAAARETAQALADQIQAALCARGERDLAGAMDRVSNEVSQLRRRVQIDERLAQMAGYQEELEQQSRELLQRQLMPAWVLLGLGGVFMCGVVLVVSGMLVSASIAGSLGWALALLGVAGTGAAGLTKLLLERSNARQFEACQKQVGMLQLQLQQAKQERDVLDQQLARGGGPIVSRLQKAEQQWAELERLVPLDARRQADQQEAETASANAALAKTELAAARRRWREALAAAQLPATLSPKQLSQWVRSADRIGQIQRRLGHHLEELQQRRNELGALAGRIRQLAVQTGAGAADEHPIQQLQHLVQSLAEQETRAQRREALRRDARRIQRRQARHEEAMARLKYRRRELLHRLGAENEQQFRQLALQQARAQVLRTQREALQREITAAIGGHCPEEAIGRLLQGDSSQRLEALRDELLERMESLEKELQERFEKRGRLSEQLKTLAEDRQLPAKQLELATVEKRLEDAVRRWQVLAVTGRILDGIRTTYEQQRQPETLREASAYLQRLTRGRYGRVWTPLGEHVLRVDDHDGNSHPVELLSRGAREQLFLAVRLALAACYARRGAILPLVLDDVLVNFDSQRAKAAAAVLRDFAQAGHQVLVFTCHEHIFKLFRSLRVPASRLPENAEPQCLPIALEHAERKKSKRVVDPEELPQRIAAGSDDLDHSPDETKSDGSAHRPGDADLQDEAYDEEEAYLWEEASEGEDESRGELYEGEADDAEAA